MTTTSMKSKRYEAAVEAALQWMELADDGYDPASKPDRAIQMAQVHAQLAIAAALRAIWMDCDCK